MRRVVSRRRAGDESRRALDGRLHAVVRHAPAQHAGHARADLGVGRRRIAREQRLRGHDLTVLAEPALRHLLVDPGLLNGIEPAVRSTALRASSRRRPSALETGITHDRTAAPLMITVQAPHWASPQPNRGPCRSRSLRRTYRSGVVGSTSTLCGPTVHAESDDRHRSDLPSYAGCVHILRAHGPHRT